MPILIVFHKPGTKRGKRCEYPLARLRVADRALGHHAVWVYQRRRFGVPDAPLCGGCKRPVGNEIGYYWEAPGPRDLAPAGKIPILVKGDLNFIDLPEEQA